MQHIRTLICHFWLDYGFKDVFLIGILIGIFLSHKAPDTVLHMAQANVTMLFASVCESPFYSGEVLPQTYSPDTWIDPIFTVGIVPSLSFLLSPRCYVGMFCFSSTDRRSEEGLHIFQTDLSTLIYYAPFVQTFLWMSYTVPYYLLQITLTLMVYFHVHLPKHPIYDKLRGRSQLSTFTY